MGQIAYKKDTGEIIEAFSLSDEQWNETCSYPLGDILMPYTNWPAIAKTSIRGFRFFAHHSGYPEKLPETKSYAHTRLQIEIVNMARERGFKADLEVRGPNPSTPEWIADVLVVSDTGKKIAFEVQLSEQNLDTFIERTSRYKKHNIDTCWVLSESLAKTLANALTHRNNYFYKETGVFLAEDKDIITLNINIPSKDEDRYPEITPLVRFGQGRHIKRLLLKDAISGVMQGFPKWEAANWKWIEA